MQQAIVPDVSMPEEVMARAHPDGNILLTWFFDEASEGLAHAITASQLWMLKELLEQLSSSGSPQTLSFEICQKSETVGGIFKSTMRD